MTRVLAKRQLAPEVFLLELHAPRIQRRWKAGQFVILRPGQDSERIPLTLVTSDSARESVTIVVQAIGRTTREVAALEPEQSLSDLVGPLGEPATVRAGERVLCMAGGVGVAELLPVAKAFRDAGSHVVALCGARTQAHRILHQELCDAANEVYWATDDGSYGYHGNVLSLMQSLYQPGDFTVGHVIGPIPMMNAVAQATRDWNLELFASLNPVMVDGTGMCGGCRVTVGGKVFFACVDGPEFNAHQVDFDELARRNRAYREQEKLALQHHCRIGLDVR